MYHALALAAALAGCAIASPLAAPAPQASSSPNSTVKCTVVFDGRVPASYASDPTQFDTYATDKIFNPDYVHASAQKWSQILKFPSGASRFDGSDYVPVEVTINDQSIFQTQNGFRRAGLQFLSDSSDGAGQTGVKTLHWSVKQDAARPLNLTHEYLNVWHESSDYSADQIMFQAGQLIGGSASDKNNFKILDRNSKVLYSVAIDKTQWQNFATTLDYTNNKVTIYYSKGNDALKSVAGPLSVNLAGGGQYQIGILKKPTGTSDVVNSGYQEKSLNEGQIYGGLFLEDSASGCVSL